MDVPEQSAVLASRASWLARADFAKAIGQQITIQAVKARDGSLYGYMDRIKLPDGHVARTPQQR